MSEWIYHIPLEKLSDFRCTVKGHWKKGHGNLGTGKMDTGKKDLCIYTTVYNCEPKSLHVFIYTYKSYTASL